MDPWQAYTLAGIGVTIVFLIGWAILKGGGGPGDDPG